VAHPLFLDPLGSQGHQESPLVRVLTWALVVFSADNYCVDSTVIIFTVFEIKGISPNPLLVAQFSYL
jgi:hypothetical protein